MIALAAEHFTDVSLRHHVLHVLARKLGTAQQADVQGETASSGKAEPTILADQKLPPAFLGIADVFRSSSSSCQCSRVYADAFQAQKLTLM